MWIFSQAGLASVVDSAVAHLCCRRHCRTPVGICFPSASPFCLPINPSTASFPPRCAEEPSPKPGRGGSGRPRAERGQTCRGAAGRRQRGRCPLEGALRRGMARRAAPRALRQPAPPRHPERAFSSPVCRAALSPEQPDRNPSPGFIGMFSLLGRSLMPQCTPRKGCSEMAFVWKSWLWVSRARADGSQVALPRKCKRVRPAPPASCTFWA